MSINRFWPILVVFCGITGVAVAQSGPDRDAFRADVKALRAELRATAMAKPPAPGGTDTDSFGRNVVFDGLLQSGRVSFQTDCTPDPASPLGPDDRCVVPNPAPGSTSFDLPDLGRLTVSARSAHSLLCHWLTPIAYYRLENSDPVPEHDATFRLAPYVVVESLVLDDPSLIDPTTGLPFEGQLVASFAATYWEQRTLGPGQTFTRQFSETRVCIEGFVNKASLMGVYGLTEAQATAVFRNPITLRFGLRGSVALVTEASVPYGLRVVGD
jgi:hypothetical protein